MDVAGLGRRRVVWGERRIRGSEVDGEVFREDVLAPVRELGLELLGEFEREGAGVRVEDGEVFEVPSELDEAEKGADFWLGGMCSEAEIKSRGKDERGTYPHLRTKCVAF